MLEYYIEKDITIKSELIQKMYHAESIILSQESKFFQVSSATLLGYLESLIDVLQPYILKTTYHHGEYKIHLKQHIPIYQYQKMIFKQSKFLKGCTLYLQGHNHYLDFVEELFISVGSAYSLKATIEQFFQEVNISPQHISELDFRLLSLAISLKTTPTFSIHKNAVFQQKINAIFPFLYQKGLVLDEGSRSYLALGFWLAYTRKDIPIVYAKAEQDYCKQLPVYNLLAEFYEVASLENFFEKSELFFLAIVLNACHYTFINIDVFNQHYQQLKELFLVSLQRETTLSDLFSQHFHSDVAQNSFFANALTKFLKTAYRNTQLLLPAKRLSLDIQEEQLNQEIEQLLDCYLQKTPYITGFHPSFVKQLTKEVHFLLDKDKMVSHLIVVMPDQLYLPLIQSILEKTENTKMNLPTKVVASYQELEKIHPNVLAKSIVFYDDRLTPPTLLLQASIPINIHTICERFT